MSGTKPGSRKTIPRRSSAATALSDEHANEPGGSPLVRSRSTRSTTDGSAASPSILAQLRASSSGDLLDDTGSILEELRRSADSTTTSGGGSSSSSDAVSTDPPPPSQPSQPNAPRSFNGTSSAPIAAAVGRAEKSRQEKLMNLGMEQMHLKRFLGSPKLNARALIESQSPIEADSSSASVSSSTPPLPSSLDDDEYRLSQIWRPEHPSSAPDRTAGSEGSSGYVHYRRERVRPLIKLSTRNAIVDEERHVLYEDPAALLKAALARPRAKKTPKADATTEESALHPPPSRKKAKRAATPTKGGSARRTLTEGSKARRVSDRVGGALPPALFSSSTSSSGEDDDDGAALDDLSGGGGAAEEDAAEDFSAGFLLKKYYSSTVEGAVRTLVAMPATAKGSAIGGGGSPRVLATSASAAAVSGVSSVGAGNGVHAKKGVFNPFQLLSAEYSRGSRSNDPSALLPSSSRLVSSSSSTARYSPTKSLPAASLALDGKDEKTSSSATEESSPSSSKNELPKPDFVPPVIQVDSSHEQVDPEKKKKGKDVEPLGEAVEKVEPLRTSNPPTTNSPSTTTTTTTSSSMGLPKLNLPTAAGDSTTMTPPSSAATTKVPKLDLSPTGPAATAPAERTYTSQRELAGSASTVDTEMAPAEQRDGLWLSFLGELMMRVLSNPMEVVTRVDLSGLQVSVLPEPFVAQIAPVATVLFLRHNTLSRLPRNLGQLQLVYHLDLSEGRFTAIPASVWALPRLRILNMAGNRINYVEEDILQCTSLRELDLSGNVLADLPAAVAQCSWLEGLSLSGNQIRRMAPEIGRMAHLLVLNVEHNEMEEFPPELCQCRRLRELRLAGNKLLFLRDELQLANLQQLVMLDLAGNRLSLINRRVSKALSTLRKLEQLVLDDNQLLRLPYYLWKYASLRSLRFSGNPLLAKNGEVGYVPPVVLEKGFGHFLRFMRAKDLHLEREAEELAGEKVLIAATPRHAGPMRNVSQQSFAKDLIHRSTASLAQPPSSPDAASFESVSDFGSAGADLMELSRAESIRSDNRDFLQFVLQGERQKTGFSDREFQVREMRRSGLRKTAAATASAPSSHNVSSKNPASDPDLHYSKLESSELLNSIGSNISELFGMVLPADGWTVERSNHRSNSTLKSNHPTHPSNPIHNKNKLNQNGDGDSIPTTTTITTTTTTTTTATTTTTMEDSEAMDDFLSSFVLQHEEMSIPFFKRFFAQEPHVDLVGHDDVIGHFYVSILKQRDMYGWAGHGFILFTEGESNLGYIDSELVSRSVLSAFPTTKSLVRGLREVLRPHLDHATIVPIASHRTDLIREVQALESRLLIRAYKFGVLYVGEGDITERQILQRASHSKAFDNFLDLLGTRIQLKGWAGYSGGLDTTNNRDGKWTVCTSFREIEMVFHVSTLMPLDPKNHEEQLSRKVHIGNDSVVLVFVDGKTQFSPLTISSKFVSAFIVVRPKYGASLDEVRYTVEISYMDSVPSQLPHLPPTGEFAHDEQFRDFLLLRLANAERACYMKPSMIYRLRRTRAGLLEEFAMRHLRKKDGQPLGQAHSPEARRRSSLFGAPGSVATASNISLASVAAPSSSPQPLPSLDSARLGKYPQLARR